MSVLPAEAAVLGKLWLALPAWAWDLSLLAVAIGESLDSALSFLICKIVLIVGLSLDSHEVK